MRLLSALAFALISAVTPLAATAAFPEKPVRLIVPFPPGGGGDSVARVLSKKLTEMWGQALVIDNKPGAQGNLGTALGAKAPADGYTIVFLVHGVMVLSPHMYSTVGFDPLKDFAPITRLTQQDFIVVAHPDSPIKNLRDVVNLARQRPGQLSFATSSTGPQLAGELLKLTSKIDMLHVGFNGAGPGSVAVMSGQTNLMISNPASVVPLIKGGRVQGVAVLGKQRNEQLPDVPTALELGFPEMSDIPEWYGLAAPARTPPAVIAKLNADIVKALQDPEVQKGIQNLGAKASPSTPAEFAAQIAKDYVIWGNVVKATGVKPNN